MEYLDIKLKGVDENGEIKDFKIKDFKGKNVVLYFYPKDETPICTKEAEYFNKYLKNFPSDTVVIGVSEDDVESHKNFKEKLDLKFKLLCDKGHELKNAIHEFVDKHFKHHEMVERATVIVNKDGEIVKAWTDVDVDGHVEEILEYLKTLK